MNGFDINKIENDDSQAEVSELLTGSVTKGLSPKTGVEPNAEVEKGEYVMYPDGTTQKVVGENHEKGGVPMNIPDGTIILTNNLKPKAKDRKVLEKEFDISIPKTATYAQIVDKYIKKIGLGKLYEEQEEAYEQLKEIVAKEGEVDEDTNSVNKEFISKKIYDIEQQKTPKEDQKRNFVEYLFGIQESNKKESNQPEEYKYGGLKKEKFEALCKKNGMSVDEGLQMLKYGGVKEYQDGGGDTLTREGLKRMHDNGEISTADYIDRINQISGDVDVDISKYNITGQPGQADPPYSESEAFTPKGVERLNTFLDQYGIDTLDPEKSTKKEALGSLKKLQSKIVKDNPDLVVDYMTNRSHKPNNKLIAKIPDSYEKTNEGLRKAYEAGDITEEDIREAYKDDKWWYRALETTQQDIPEAEYNELIRQAEEEGIGVKQGDSLYFPDPSDPQKYIKYNPIPSEDQPVEEETDATEGVEDKAQVPERDYPRMFYTPDQRTLPPTNMLPHLRTKTRLGRIDPVRVGVEQNLQNISDTRQFTADQLKDMNPQQRAGALAALTASSQQAENQAITQANRVNAQNQAQAELFNIGQSDREQMQDARSALDFERRQYTARDRYDQNLRDWFLRNQKVALSDYDYNRKMNLTDSLFPDYTPNFYGNRIEFDPETEYNVQNRGTLLRTMGNMGV